MKIKELIPQQDMIDAKQVFKDWLFHVGASTGSHDLDAVFNRAVDAATYQDLDPNSIAIHHDWGRRPKNNTPVIVMRIMPDKYIVLDGQHRILKARDDKSRTIKTMVLDIPLRYSKPVKRYYLD